mmetsp:Transcript_7099/g.14015  ORF Transcript_7099/g.14015 Transcript_7099/m.14015 type:complete len:214 (+) Transcript_7099:287-928(+)
MVITATFQGFIATCSFGSTAHTSSSSSMMVTVAFEGFITACPPGDTTQARSSSSQTTIAPRSFGSRSSLVASLSIVDGGSNNITKRLERVHELEFHCRRLVLGICFAMFTVVIRSFFLLRWWTPGQGWTGRSLLVVVGKEITRTLGWLFIFFLVIFKTSPRTGIVIVFFVCKEILARTLFRVFFLGRLGQKVVRACKPHGSLTGSSTVFTSTT